MAEYIDIDAPIDVALYQRNKRAQITIRQILESNDAKYKCSDVVERKHGKWIDPADLICYKCTACGMYANQGYGLDEPIFWDYCPNCGAMMESEGE